MAAIEVTLAFVTLGAACAVGSNFVPKMLRDQNERKIAQRDLAELTMNRLLDKSSGDSPARASDRESGYEALASEVHAALEHAEFKHAHLDETLAVDPSSPSSTPGSSLVERGKGNPSKLFAAIGGRFARKPKIAIVSDTSASEAHEVETSDVASVDATAVSSMDIDELTRYEKRAVDVGQDEVSESEYAMADPVATNGSADVQKPKKQGRLKFPPWKKQSTAPKVPSNDFEDLFASAGAGVEARWAQENAPEPVAHAYVYTDPTIIGSRAEEQRAAAHDRADAVIVVAATDPQDGVNAHPSPADTVTPENSPRKIHLSIGSDDDDDSGFISWSPPLAAADAEPTMIPPAATPVNEPTPHIALLMASDEHVPAATVPVTETAAPKWTIEFVEALIPNPTERCELVDDLVALGDDLRPGVLADIYEQDEAVRLVLIAAVSDYASSQALDVLSRAIRDSNPALVTTALDKLVYRREYEIAANALGNVDVAPYALAQLRPHLADVDERLSKALSEQDVDRVRQAMSLA